MDWLGHTPYKVTFSSDYFEELFSLAVKLINKGKAYVCHMSKDEMRSRGRREQIHPIEIDLWRRT